MAKARAIVKRRKSVQNIRKITRTMELIATARFKKGTAFCRFRQIPVEKAYLQFEDRPQFDEVETLANAMIGMYLRGEIDRVEVAYTRFINSARQEAVLETLLPMTAGDVAATTQSAQPAEATGRRDKVQTPYEFVPDAESILSEIVPVSFKIRLFKCFLDAAVSEQIARMVAMRGATENADDMVKSLTMLYNRARQAQITRELAEIIGGAAALE